MKRQRVTVRLNANLSKSITEVRRLEKKYAEGYRRKPEQANDFKPLFLSGLKCFDLWEVNHG